MNPLWIPVALAGVAIVVLFVLLRRRSREADTLRSRLEHAAGNLERLQQAFGRFAPEEIVERVIARGVSTGGERKEVTVLFSDLVGYTSLAESIDPDVLVRILNGYFERMSRAITDHRGHVSTLIGDGILAFFGALEPNPWQGDDAVRAALSMRSELAEYNGELRAEGLPELSLGVGLHRGVGVAALVGSRDLIQYAFVGRTINVAARVQDLTRSVDADILVTEALQKTLDAGFELHPQEPAELKGIAEPVRTWAVMAQRS
jgi:adenylate cyclase